MSIPSLYVIAGPNGIGKTTSAYDLIPKNIPIINSDEIARLARSAGVIGTNAQEYSNREANNLVNQYIEERRSFGIETNLSDSETWKFLIETKKLGYQIDIIFLSTDTMELLNKRIEERARRGEHFVYPDIVKERYEKGLLLLRHYFDVPDKIQLIDNSDYPELVYSRTEHQVLQHKSALPEWVANLIAEKSFEPEIDIRNLSSKEEVLKVYEHSKNKK